MQRFLTLVRDSQTEPVERKICTLSNHTLEPLLEQDKALVTIECKFLNQIVSKWGNDSPEFPDNPHRKKTLGERHVGISPEGIYIYGRNRSNEKGTLEGIGEATVCIDNHGL